MRNKPEINELSQSMTENKYRDASTGRRVDVEERLRILSTDLVKNSAIAMEIRQEEIDE